jgi:hypothetical protein
MPSEWRGGGAGTILSTHGLLYGVSKFGGSLLCDHLGPPAALAPLTASRPLRDPFSASRTLSLPLHVH